MLQQMERKDETADEDLGRFDLTNPERRGQYFLEWRLTDAAVVSEMARVQALLKEAEPTVEILQSCAADNLHITMNELTLNSEEEVRRCLTVIREFEAAHFATINPADAMTVVRGLGSFNKRVLFVTVDGNGGADVLTQLYSALDARLVAAGFKPKNARPFQPHITVCKAPRGAKVLPESVFQCVRTQGLDTTPLGRQPLNELVFCVKRTKAERTPPVIHTLRARGDGGHTGV